jgi:hypothetical protein
LNRSVVVPVCLLAVLALIVVVPRVRDWRPAASYRNTATATVERLGVPDLPGAAAVATAEQWSTCHSSSCAVEVRSFALPRHPTFDQVASAVSRWGVKGHLFRRGVWTPTCQFKITDGPGGFGCEFAYGPLPGVPSQTVYVAFRFADPQSVQATNAGLGVFIPNAADRVSSLSVAVMAYDPNAGD